MYLLYSLLLACVAVLSLPWWVLQMLRLGKYRAGLAQRLGSAPPQLKNAGPGSIWLHAVSVGEVLAVSRLVNELQTAFPGTQVFVSTTTATGQRLARERFGESRCFYMPLDLGLAVRPYLNALRPRMLLLAETEFWPNLLHLARSRGTAIAVVNARISDRSFPRYRRFRWFFRRVLANVDLFLAQTSADADRLRQIGAASERIQVSGNLKFDIRPPAAGSLPQELRAAAGQGSPILVCGSTAEGEEDALLQAFAVLRARFAKITMVIAPRHPERFEKVAGLISGRGFTMVRRSRWTPSALPEGSVFLLDSVGELASVYSVADIAFVGGSLLPTGGHNILEPAQYGAAIVVGPHTFNFREIMQIFERDRAVRVVTAAELAACLLDLTGNADERRRLGERAKALFEQHAGATGRSLVALRPLLTRRQAGEQ